MKILHIVPDIDPKNGGPTRSVTGICRALAREGADTTLFVHSPRFQLEDTSGLRFITGGGTNISQVWQDTASVIRDIHPDLIHLHGLWRPSHHVDAFWARKFKIPYIVSPRGMLEPWALNAKKWKKRLALWLYQKRDLICARALHATAVSEADQFRKLGFKQPVIVLPNGVEAPANLPPRTFRADGKRTALFLSRIHPKKGLIELVEAWTKIRSSNVLKCGSAKVDRAGNCVVGTNEFLNWHFEYAGPDFDGHLAAVQKRMRELGVESDFTYLGELSDQEKWTVYRHADLFVLPTYSENFGIVIAEALAAGVPVITTKGTPWGELENCESALMRECLNERMREKEIRECGGEKCGNAGMRECLNERDGNQAIPQSGSLEQSENHSANTESVSGNQALRPVRAGWWIDIGVEPLAHALKEAMSLTNEERSAMGENGRKLVETQYNWHSIAQRMICVYNWVLKGGTAPDCVKRN